VNEIRSLLFYMQKAEKPPILFCPEKVFQKFEQEYDVCFRRLLRENTMSEMYQKGYRFLSSYKEILVTWADLGEVSEKTDWKKLLGTGKRLIDVHAFFRFQGLEVTRSDVQSLLLSAVAKEKIKVVMGFYSVK